MDDKCRGVCGSGENNDQYNPHSYNMEYSRILTDMKVCLEFMIGELLEGKYVKMMVVM